MVQPPKRYYEKQNVMAILRTSMCVTGSQDIQPSGQERIMSSEFDDNLPFVAMKEGPFEEVLPSP